jgi:uncharacterized damage-inducible protein DinB
MKHCYLPFIFLLLSQVAFGQDNFLLAAQKKWQSASKYTQQVMDAMPQKHYGFKPVKDEMSFEEQLLHMANNMNWLGAKFLSSQPSPYSERQLVAGKSRKEIVEILNQSMAYIQNVLADFKPEHLNDPVDFPAEKLNKQQIITLLNDHHTHHRAQLLVYLRLKGEKPPKYVGW